MQVGYSFLIGGMCTIVLLKTGNLIYSILLHAVYDLGGNLLQIGGGARWDTVTVILTVLIGLVVSAVMIAVLLKIDPMETEKFYKMKEGKISDEHDQN